MGREVGAAFIVVVAAEHAVARAPAAEPTLPVEQHGGHVLVSGGVPSVGLVPGVVRHFELDEDLVGRDDPHRAAVYRIEQHEGLVQREQVIGTGKPVQVVPGFGKPQIPAWQDDDRAVEGRVEQVGRGHETGQDGRGV